MSKQPISGASSSTPHSISAETSAGHLATLLRIVDLASLSEETRLLREKGLSWGVFGSDTQEWRSDQPLEILIGKLMRAAGASKGPLRGVGMSCYAKNKVCAHGAYLRGGRAWIGAEIHLDDSKSRMTLVGIENESNTQTVSNHERMRVGLLFRNVQDATLRSMAVERLLCVRHGKLQDVSHTAKDFGDRGLPANAAIDAIRAEQEADVIKVVASDFIPDKKADDEPEDKIRVLMRAARGINRLRQIGVGRWVENGRVMSLARCSYLPRSQAWVNIQVGGDNKARLAVVGLLWSKDVTEASSHQRLSAKARFSGVRDKALRQEGVERLLRIWIPHRLETADEAGDDTSPAEKQAELVEVIADLDQIIHAQHLAYELENDGGEPRLVWRPRKEKDATP